MRLRKRTKNTLNKHSCGKFLPQLFQSEHNAVKMMKFCLFVFTERTWNSFCGNNVVPSLLTQFITLIKENNSKRNKTGQNESISRHKKKENPATPRFHTCPWSCTHICRPCTFSDFFFFLPVLFWQFPFNSTLHVSGQWGWLLLEKHAAERRSCSAEVAYLIDSGHNTSKRCATLWNPSYFTPVAA